MIMSWTKHSSQGDGVVWMAGLVSNSNPVDKGKRSYSKSDMGKHDGQAESIATIVYFRVYKKKKKKVQVDFVPWQLIDGSWKPTSSHVLVTLLEQRVQQIIRSNNVKMCQENDHLKMYQIQTCYQTRGRERLVAGEGRDIALLWQFCSEKNEAETELPSLSSSQVIDALIVLSQVM